MKAYGFDNARHILDDTDCVGCRLQGAPTRKARRDGTAACKDIP